MTSPRSDVAWKSPVVLVVPACRGALGTPLAPPGAKSNKDRHKRGQSTHELYGRLYLSVGHAWDFGGANRSRGLQTRPVDTD